MSEVLTGPFFILCPSRGLPQLLALAKKAYKAPQEGLAKIYFG